MDVTFRPLRDPLASAGGGGHGLVGLAISLLLSGSTCSVSRRSSWLGEFLITCRFLLAYFCALNMLELVLTISLALLLIRLLI